MNNQHGVPTWSGWFEFSKDKYEAAAIKYILIMRPSTERYTCSCIYSFSSFELQQEISNKVVCAISILAVWSEPLLVAWIFYDC